MGIRLNKYLSLCGIAARRKSDQLIHEGNVSVNGAIVSKPQTIINPKDKVKYKNILLKPQNFEYYKINKPRFCLTSMSPNEKKRTILEYLPHTDAKIFPIGRLDYDTEGLLLFTNDGDFAQRVSHPSYLVNKTYLCHVEGSITENLFKRMQKGANLKDGYLKPEEILIQSKNSAESIVKITIHEGRNHIIKNFFKYFSKNVKKLKRISIGHIKLGELETGKSIKLDYNEIKELIKEPD